jgi:hypothetical protein
MQSYGPQKCFHLKVDNKMDAKDSFKVWVPIATLMTQQRQ